MPHSFPIRLRFCVPFLLVGLVTYGQNNTPSPAVVQPIPPSPTAEALGRYAETPVNQYTGVPDISIPLWQIQEGDIKVPISLSYHGGGVKVEESASWVGLGWSLNAGGVITRSVRGLPDERGYFVNANLGGSPANQLPSQLIDPGDNASVANLCQIENAASFANTVATGGGDSEPDIYFFNFNGITGKFIRDQNGTPYTIPYQKLIIQQQGDQSWTIITQDGMKYTFAVMELTQPVRLSYAVYGGATGDNTNASVPYVSSWYLSKIESPSGRTVTFSYTAESYTVTTGESQYLSINLTTASSGPYYPTVTGQQLLTSGYRLSSISYSNGTVSFNANTARTDISSAANPNLLSNISISNNNGVIKQWLLNTSYFTSNDQLQSFLTRRLKLNSVQECDASGSLCKPPYLFYYDSTYPLPSRISTSQDHWGYYNGANNVDVQGNPTLIPNIQLSEVATITEQAFEYDGGAAIPNFSAQYNQPTRSIQYQGASREPNFDYAASGLLEQISYPTGGFTRFQYEGNDFALTTPVYQTVQEGQNIVSDPGGDTPPTTTPNGTTEYVQTYTFTPSSVIPAADVSLNSTVNCNVNFSFNNGGQPAFCCGCQMPFATLTDLTTGVTLIEAFGQVGYPSTYSTDIANEINLGIIQVQESYENSEEGGQTIWNQFPYWNYSNIPLNPAHSYQVQVTDFDCSAASCEVDGTSCQKPPSDPPTFSSANTSWAYQTQTINNYNSAVGGLRIKKILDYSNLSAPLVRQYTYISTDTPSQSSGTILDYPIYYDQYASVSSNPSAGDGGGSNNLPIQGAYSQILTTPGVMLTSGSKFELGQTNGSFVGYSVVEESIMPDSLSTSMPLGKTVYRYTSGNDYSDINSRAFGTTFWGTFSSLDCSTATPQQAANGAYDMSWLIPSTIFPTDNVYPYPPKTSYDWKRGLLTSREEYDSASVLRRKVENSYNLVIDTTNSVTIYGIKIVVPPGGSSINPSYGTYSTIAAWNYQNGEKTTEVDVLGNQLVTNKTFYYDNPPYAQLTRQQYINSKGDTVWTTMKYADDLGTQATTGTPNIYDTMVTRNMIGMPIQTAKLNNSTFQQSLTTNYGSYGSVIKEKNIQTQTLTAAQENRVQFLNYDGKGNILEQAKVSDKHISYIWDYNGSYPIAEVDNASQSDIAYTSFEADGSGNWTVGGGTVDGTLAVTGTNSYILNGSISCAGLNSTTTYLVSYWSQNGAYSIPGTISGYPQTGKTVTPGTSANTWTLYVHKVTGQSTISLSGNGHIDELRLYPSTAQMTTYTYDPLVGMTSHTDAGNRATYYQYDGLDRLIRIRDQDYNILKTIAYQYQAPAGCGSGCYAVGMQTFAGSSTLSYPVGVFDIHGKLLGNASDSAAYISAWNSDTADNRLGTLAAGTDSMHFNLTLNAGQTMVAGVTGCRYYQYDLSYTQLDAVGRFNAGYIDFGDGTTTQLPTDTIGFKIPANTIVGSDGYSRVVLIHSYPDTTLKTIALYHSDLPSESPGLLFFNNHTSEQKLKNLRGNIPQFTRILDYINYQQPSTLSVQSVANWNSITSIDSFLLQSIANTGSCMHLNFSQDFMKNNKNLQTIDFYDNLVNPWSPGYIDSTFKISRLKSDWNTYFTNLKALSLSDYDWNREDLSHLTQLAWFVLVCDNALHNNNTASPAIPLPVAVIDTVINQIAAGAGKNSQTGYILFTTGGTNRSSASDAAYNLLVSKGWTIIIDNITF